MSERSLPWFRFYSEAVDDEKLRLLAFEDRWHFVAILCCKNSGVIDSADPLLRRKMAVKLGLSITSLDEVARRLDEVGLIDFETLQPLAWDDRQMVSDSSSARVKAYRERMKRPCNVTVTAQDTDTDTDTDKEQEKNLFADEPPATPKKQAKRASQLPEDFEPDETGKALARELGIMQGELAQFRDYHTAKGTTMKDWQAGWRTWVRNAAKFARSRAPSTSSRPVLDDGQKRDYGKSGKL